MPGQLADNQEPILPIDDSSINDLPILKFSRFQWWLLVVVNIFFLLAGQCAAVLLGRFYYDKGGNSKWLATLLQTVAFPILLIPFILIPSSYQPSSPTQYSITIISIIYIVLGVMIAGDNMLYSTGLLYLSASTYSLICATQLAFNAIFSYFINSQKFTMHILNSVVVLSFSASLLSVNEDTNGPSGLSKSKYVLGFLTTLFASALYSLLLSLMQLTFQKVLKKETFSVVLEMQIYTSIVATCVSLVGLFASGEWRTLSGEMAGFKTGRGSYVLTLVFAAISWQVCSVGVVGLIFVVTSLFSNVISTFSLALTPIAAVIVFHDNMNGAKIIAMLMAFWGFASYIYQNYLDDLKTKKLKKAADSTLSSSC